MQSSRDERLASDYRDMLSIQDRPYLSWIVTKGEPPYAEEYLLTVKVRTYALTSKSNIYTVGTIHRCTVRVTLWDSYPNIAPHIRMLNIPSVFHPDWYSMGTYCSSEPWRPDRPLKDHLMRMIGTIMYDPSLITGSAPANCKALDWYMKHRDDSSLFPSDKAGLTVNTLEELAAAERAMIPFDEIIDSWPVHK